ncbi:acyl-CoA dehydrogenase [Streptomyces sp. Root431]|uniref:acyl-CoA dehydrogenase family protein n=1 Tax=Streptomyces sp. Root431 TaxID=1736535 RepID=UPI0006FCD90C|nr:acyl-CoA dehydrogenase family protein [Streptomyces sp. Root431]KQX11656.1 acyl-CoA dehydrogenase [Streptomyces sp. Root431]
MDAADTAALAAALTEEQQEIQQEIRHTLRDLLTERAGPRENREATATPEGYDTELWARLSGTLGLAGLALPEQYGGAGHGPAALALACEETGRALAPSPLLATAVLAAPLIAALGTPDQRAELLPRIADGSLTCALAVPGGSLTLALGLTGDNTAEDWSGGGRAGGIQARATDEAGAGDGGAGWRLYGEATQVLDGHSADLLLVAAHTGGFARSRTLLFLVRGRGRGDGAPGLVRTRRSVLDPTRPQAVVELRDAEAELLGEEPADVLGALATTGRTAAVLLAAEAVGAAGSVLDRTIAHLGARERSGRSEGALLAVKGTLAALYVQVEAARSLTYSAAREPGSECGPLALAQALEALRATAGECVRLDGDAGTFSGGEAQLYFQRAASDELLFGPARRLRARAAERTGLFGEVAA